MAVSLAPSAALPLWESARGSGSLRCTNAPKSSDNVACLALPLPHAASRAESPLASQRSSQAVRRRRGRPTSSAAAAAAAGGSGAFTTLSGENSDGNDGRAAEEVLSGQGAAAAAVQGGASGGLGVPEAAAASVAAARARRHRPGQMEFVVGQEEFRPTRKTVAVMAAVALLVFLNRNWLFAELLRSSLLILALLSTAVASSGIFLIFLAHSLLLFLPQPLSAPIFALLSLLSSAAQFSLAALLALLDLLPVGPTLFSCALAATVITVAQRFEARPGEHLDGPLWLAAAAATGLLTGVVAPSRFAGALLIVTACATGSVLRIGDKIKGVMGKEKGKGKEQTGGESADVASPNWLTAATPAVAALAGAAENVPFRLLVVGAYLVLAVWLNHSGRIRLQRGDSALLPATAAVAGRKAGWKLHLLDLIQAVVLFTGLVAVRRWAHVLFLAWQAAV